MKTRRHAANQDTPVFLAHGSFDPVVPFSRAESALKKLNDLGYAVDWHEYEMDHTLCMPEIHDISDWLTKVLA